MRKLGFQSGSFSGSGFLEGLYKIEPSSYGFTYRIPVCYNTSRLLASCFLLCSNPQWTGGFKCRKYGCLSKEMFEKRLWFADPSESQPSQLNERWERSTGGLTTTNQSFSQGVLKCCLQGFAFSFLWMLLLSGFLSRSQWDKGPKPSLFYVLYRLVSLIHKHNFVTQWN